MSAGDLVLASPASVTRVLLNQHVPSKSTSHFVTLHFGGGKLALTPDHVLAVDGAMAPARGQRDALAKERQALPLQAHPAVRRKLLAALARYESARPSGMPWPTRNPPANKK